MRINHRTWEPKQTCSSSALEKSKMGDGKSFIERTLSTKQDAPLNTRSTKLGRPLGGEIDNGVGRHQLARSKWKCTQEGK